MKINLRSLRIINFKGIANFEVPFNHITSIWGDNATGKTTVFDAFLWLFFGKNSEDVSQFEVKRLDINNRFVPKQESEVSAVIHVDGQEIEVKKVLRQKWQKRRGELEENYNGDENIYYWNDVPLKEGEFKEKIKAIVDESTFRLITNPFYFNSIPWAKRRDILITIAGNISHGEIIETLAIGGNTGQYDSLVKALNQGKSIEEFKKELAAKKKKVKDEAEGIPDRIDEVRRGISHLDTNYDLVREAYEKASNELNGIQAMINDESLKMAEENKARAGAMRIYNKAITDRNQKVFDLKQKMQNMYFDAKSKAKESGSQLASEISSTKTQLTDKKLRLETYTNNIVQLQQQISEKERRVQILRERYEIEDEKQLLVAENEFTCPACQQPLPADNIEQKKKGLEKNFNADKLTRLTGITNEAKATQAEIENLNLRIKNGNSTVEDLKKEITQFEKDLTKLNEQDLVPQQDIEDVTAAILAKTTTYADLAKEIKNLEDTKFVEPESTPIQTDEELVKKRDGINSRLSELSKELAGEDQLKIGQKRIQELTDQESTLAKQLVELEGQEFAIMQFTKAKVDAIERRINGKFSYVKFKMFNQQVNGGETECCDTLINSNGSFVPFQDANNAAKINAGIDIINTLCQHYDVYAPIFIDNRESVTRLIDSDSQIVNLIVNEADKKLRVA